MASRGRPRGAVTAVLADDSASPAEAGSPREASGEGGAAFPPSLLLPPADVCGVVRLTKRAASRDRYSSGRVRMDPSCDLSSMIRNEGTESQSD